jgi:radial spoke head protein 4A
LSADVPAWTARLASQLSPIRYSPVFLRSNRWPGAFVVGYSEKFANIYVGWGIKDLGRPFVPVALPPVQKEFSSEEPLEEKQDATAEEEREYDQVNKKSGDKAADGDADEEEAEEDA